MQGITRRLGDIFVVLSISSISIETSSFQLGRLWQIQGGIYPGSKLAYQRFQLIAFDMRGNSMDHSLLPRIFFRKMVLHESHRVAMRMREIFSR
jgi:hypothetical protein